MWRSEIDEPAKRLKLWVRRKRGNRALICSGCGRRVHGIAAVYEREVRDLPCFEYRTTVVIELYRVKCPDCGWRFSLADRSQWNGRRHRRCGRLLIIAEDASSRAGDAPPAQRATGRR